MMLTRLRSFGASKGGVDVDVNAAGGVHKSACFSQVSDHLLHSFNIFVLTDGTDQFHAVASISTYFPSAFFSLAVNTGIAHDFPFAPLAVTGIVNIVIGAPSYSLAVPKYSAITSAARLLVMPVISISIPKS